MRLAGIDERERLSNRDVFGRACFFSDGLQVEKVGNGYQVKPGLAYIEGVRIYSPTALPVPGKALPTTVWLDVVLERQLNDVVARWSLACDGQKVDYQDALGVWHYCIALADLSTQAIADRRPVEAITGPLVQHFAARVGDYQHLRARATTKADVELENLPNAKSDDPSTDSSEILATTKAVHSVQAKVGDLVEGTTPAGKAKQLATARKIAATGAATGSAQFDGTQDIAIQLTLADAGVVPGAYPKVVINAKGLVIGNQALLPGDIPNLDWSKITSGKPTTLAGYGITDALRSGYSDQVPRFYSPTPGTTYQTPALEIREAQLVMDSQDGWSYAPRMFFHWGGRTAGDLAMNSAGILLWNANTIWHSANFNPDYKADKATTLAGYGITDGLKIGDCGLGSSDSPVNPTPDAFRPKGGFSTFYDAPTSLASMASVMTMPYVGGDFCGQIAMQQGVPVPRIFVRSIAEPKKWTPTVELWHSGNLTPNDIVPAGTQIVSYSRKTPAGCLRTNGAAVSRTAYARLFAEIGTFWGGGDGYSTFNLPDSRGIFTRDVDDGRGLDPGRVQGSVQFSQNAWHTHGAVTTEAGWHYHPGSTVTIAEGGAHPHTLQMGGYDVAGQYPGMVAPGGGQPQPIQAVDQGGSHIHGATLSMMGDGVHTHGVTVSNEGGSEARPVNLALYHYIKY